MRSRACCEARPARRGAARTLQACPQDTALVPDGNARLPLVSRVIAEGKYLWSESRRRFAGHLHTTLSSRVHVPSAPGVPAGLVGSKHSATVPHASPHAWPSPAMAGHVDVA